MKSTIAVIGAAGNMGSGITKNLAKAGYRILVAGNSKSKLYSLIQNIKTDYPNADVEILDCLKEASWESDIIIPAVPYKNQNEVAEKIKDVVTGKIVISIVNPLNDTLDELLTNASTSAAEELALMLPHSKIVKAFNTLSSSSLESSVVDGKIIDSFIAGDDDTANEVVAELIKDSGFNPLMTGKLINSRILENMALLLIKITMKNNYNLLSGWKVLR